MTPQMFIAKWRRANLSERQTAQEHFTDLCRVLGQPTALSLYLSDDVPDNPEQLTPVGEVQADTAAATVDLDDATGRFLTIWFTSLPTVPGGFKGGIVDLVVAG